MRWGAGVLGLVCFLGGLAAQEKLIHTDSLLAVVGDRLITTYDVTSSTRAGEEYLSLKYLDDDSLIIPKEQEALEQEMLRYRHAVARELVNREVIYGEFQRRGFVLPEELVSERLARIIAKRADGDREKFIEQLRRQQMTLADFRDRLRKQAAVELLTAQQVDRSVRIAPGDISAYYEANKDEFRVQGRVTLRLLSIRKQGLSEAELKKKVDQVTAALAGDAPFASAVQAYSHGYAREQGGLLPEMKTAELNQAYRKAIQGLKKGQVSKPFEHAGSVTWLYIDQLVPGELKPLKTVHSKIKAILARRAKAERYQAFIRELRRKTYTRIYFGQEE